MFAIETKKIEVALLFFLCSYLVLGCTSKKQEPTLHAKVTENQVEVKDLSLLTLEKVERKMFAETLVVSGKIGVPESDVVYVSARFQGRVESLRHVLGDPVKSGDILAEIWSPDLATAAAEWFSALKNADQEMMGLTRSKLKSLGLNPADLKTENQERFPIRSPISGAVLERKVSNGSSIQLGDPMFVIGKVTRYEFVADVPPEDAQKIRKSMKVTFADFPGLEAQVESISPVSDPQTRLNRLRAHLPLTLPKPLFVESLLKGQVVLREKEELVIPSKSIVRTTEREVVFLRDPKSPNIFRRIPISIINRQETYTSVQGTTELIPSVDIVSKGALLLESLIEDN